MVNFADCPPSLLSFASCLMLLQRRLRGSGHCRETTGCHKVQHVRHGRSPVDAPPGAAHTSRAENAHARSHARLLADWLSAFVRSWHSSVRRTACDCARRSSCTKTFLRASMTYYFMLRIGYNQFSDAGHSKGVKRSYFIAVQSKTCRVILIGKKSTSSRRVCGGIYGSRFIASF